MGERARPPRTPDEPEAEARQAAAEPPQQGLSMASLARQPPDARSATLARLSPAAGNAVLARVYGDWSLAEIDRDVEEAMKPDAAIKIDLGTASPRDKLVEIRRLNGASEWKGAGEVWDSFGTAMADFALANRALFEATLEHRGHLSATTASRRSHRTSRRPSRRGSGRTSPTTSSTYSRR